MVRIIPTHFESHGELVNGNLVLPDNEGPYPGICKFHGLPGSSDQVSGMATALANAGFGVLTFNFRGFRKSEGFFSLSGEIEDGHNSITHLLERNDIVDTWLGVYGASFGAAVAVYCAATDSRINAIAIRAPVFDTEWFSNSQIVDEGIRHVNDFAPDEMHGINDPTVAEEMIAQLREDAVIYNPMRVVDRISPRPLLVIHGTDDDLIPLSGVEQLYERAKDPKSLIVVEGADHNLSNRTAYETTTNTVVDWFIKQCPTL